MKKFITLVLAMLLIVSSLAGCAKPAQEPVQEEIAAPAEEAAEEPAQPQTVMFTDSLGRKVELPKDLNKIAISGPMAQIVLFALAPDKLVGISNEWDPGAEEYFDEKYFNLPVLGQLYGGKGELNLETLLASGAQVVIDVGEAKDGAVEELNALQEQTGIPFVHISATTETMGDAYRTLGEMLNMQAEAAVLGDYCDSVYARTVEISNSVDKVKLLYCLGDSGINVIAKDSYHGEVIDLLSHNLAVVDSPSSKGTGNEVDMEQILNWNPDVIIFSPESIYATVGEDEVWQGVNAIASGRYYEVPYGPYNWLGFPPSAQRYMGMMWMSQLLYPETANYDLYAEISKYFELFYHCELTEEQYNAFMANSINK